MRCLGAYLLESAILRRDSNDSLQSADAHIAPPNSTLASSRPGSKAMTDEVRQAGLSRPLTELGSDACCPQRADPHAHSEHRFHAVTRICPLGQSDVHLPVDSSYIPNDMFHHRLRTFTSSHPLSNQESLLPLRGKAGENQTEKASESGTQGLG